MSSINNFIIWLNNRLVRLYPSAYREEFAEEMQDVFSQIVLETGTQGNMKLASHILKEIRDFPANLVREHWLDITKKEPIMVTNSPSIRANLCPRCATPRPEEARYCLNCGRAFIPFHTSLMEKFKRLVNAKLFFYICCLAILAVLVPWAIELIVDGLYHPVSLIVFSVLVTGFSIFLGWRLARKKSNLLKLRNVVLISAVVGLTFIGLIAIDRIYLRSIANSDNTVAYQALGMDTFISKWDSEETFQSPCMTRGQDCIGENIILDPNSGRIEIEVQKAEFISSVCEDQEPWCMSRRMRIFSQTEKPKILIERSRGLSEPAYLVIFTAYAIGFVGIAYLITRKRTSTELAVS